MQVHEFCMFHNEHAALAIKQRESARWVDRLYLCQSDRTFRNEPRELVEIEETPFVRPLVYPGSRRFHPAYAWGPSRRFPFFRKRKRARQNEAMQRNHVHEVLSSVGDGDIVVLSDVDEIIDARHADAIVDAARTHGIVSVRLHHTLFYLNLYSTNWHEVWPGSPPDYAYRVFAMTGAHFHAMRRTSDELRQAGEQGKLAGEIHLLDGYRGFHHSWLGGEEAALAKIRSYAHSFGEHRADLTTEDGRLDEAKFREFVRRGESIFSGHNLEIRDFAEIEWLQSVRDMQTDLQEFIL